VHCSGYQRYALLACKPPASLCGLRYRCQKYWLKGTDKGKTEIFIDNLPGGPDNIYLAPDGSFWIAVLQVLQKIWNSAGFIFFSF